VNNNNEKEKIIEVLDENGNIITNNAEKRSHLFQKGSAPKSRGRPKTSPQVKRMLKAATENAVHLLTTTMENESVDLKLRIKCAEVIIDKTVPKALEIDVASDSNLDFRSLSIEQLVLLANPNNNNKTE
jgi:hypothetical protein